MLSRPELRVKAPNLTPERVKEVLAAAVDRADWFSAVPKAFTWAMHPDDDHVFNLAITAKADFLVTWESRIHKLAADTSDDANRLRSLAPQLQIINPKELSLRLRQPEVE